MPLFLVNFRTTREKLYSTLCEEQDITKVVESLHIILTTPDEVEKYVEMMHSNSSDNCIILYHYNIEILNLFDSELQLINTKPKTENIFKDLLSKLKKLKFRKY